MELHSDQVEYGMDGECTLWMIWSEWLLSDRFCLQWNGVNCNAFCVMHFFFVSSYSIERALWVFIALYSCQTNSGASYIAVLLFCQHETHPKPLLIQILCPQILRGFRCLQTTTRSSCVTSPNTNRYQQIGSMWSCNLYSYFLKIHFFYF